MRTKKFVSVVVCVAMLLSSLSLNFALDSETINSLCEEQVTSGTYAKISEGNNLTTTKLEEEKDETLVETSEEEVEENNSETSTEEVVETANETSIEESFETTLEMTDETTTIVEENSETVTETIVETNAETTAETTVETTNETVAETTTQAKTEVADENISTISETDKESEEESVSTISEIEKIVGDMLFADVATVSMFGNINEETTEATTSDVKETNTSEEIKGREVKRKNRNVAYGGRSVGYKVDNVKKENKEALFGTAFDSYFDMRTRNNSYGVPIIPPIRDQNPFGTCWAFSTIGMFETSLRMKNIVDSEEHPGADLSEAAMAYFTFEGLEEVTDPNKSTYAIDNPGVESGDYTSLNYDWWWREKQKSRASMSFADCGGDQTAATLVASSYMGVVSEVDFPHTVENITDIHKNGIGNRAAYAFNKNRYELVNTDYIAKNDIEIIKDAILKNGSVGITYYEFRDESNCHQDDNGEWYFFCPDKSCKILPDGSCGEEKDLSTNHCVMVVGWDDNVDNSKFYYDGQIYEDKGSYIVASYSVIEDGDVEYYPTYKKQVSPEGKKGAWLLRNSWGDDNYLSNHGYFWLSYYDYNTDNVLYAVDADEAGKYKYNYHYDTTANESSNTLAGYGGKMANIFHVNDSENQMLEAVNIAWQSANVDYTVYIYQNDNPMNNPEDGELTLTQKVHHDTAGIKTVPLDNRLLLPKGSYYSIIITSSNQNNSVFIDFAYVSDDADRFYFNEIKEKQSWFISDGKWKTIGAEFSVGNKDYGQTPRIKGLANEAKVITFEPGGGSGTMALQAANPREKINIAKNEFKRSGYSFYKWIDPDGNEYDEGEEIILDDDVTLTATWKMNPSPSPSSGGSGGSSGGSGLGPITNAVNTKTVFKTKTSKDAVDASSVRWVYEPATNTWGLNILINDVAVKAKDDFFYIKETRKTIVNNVETVVELVETYYIDENGSMATGWVKTGDGKTYFFENAKTKDEGKMIVGWKQIQNAWYYFNADGTMLTNAKTPDGYTIGADGKMI